MASFTTVQYLASKIPNLSTVMPGVDPVMIVTGAMSMYWDQFFPVDQYPVSPELEDSVLTERRKVLCALRAAVTLFPAIIQYVQTGSGFVTEGSAEPATAKFEERAKSLKIIADMMQTELSALEAAEGIVLETDGAGIPPAYLLSVGFPVPGGCPEHIVQRGIIDTGGMP